MTRLDGALPASKEDEQKFQVRTKGKKEEG